MSIRPPCIQTPSGAALEWPVIIHVILIYSVFYLELDPLFLRSSWLLCVCMAWLECMMMVCFLISLFVFEEYCMIHVGYSYSWYHWYCQVHFQWLYLMSCCSELAVVVDFVPQIYCAEFHLLVFYKKKGKYSI